jgi:hypothetical protein
MQETVHIVTFKVVAPCILVDPEHHNQISLPRYLKFCAGIFARLFKKP